MCKQSQYASCFVIDCVLPQCQGLDQGFLVDMRHCWGLYQGSKVSISQCWGFYQGCRWACANAGDCTTNFDRRAPVLCMHKISSSSSSSSSAGDPTRDCGGHAPMPGKEEKKRRKDCAFWHQFNEYPRTNAGDLTRDSGGHAPRRAVRKSCTSWRLDSGPGSKLWASQ